MTLTDYTLGIAEQRALNYLNDSFNYGAAGIDGTAYSDSQTALVDEIYRNLLGDKNLNLTEKYIIFGIRVPATQSDGYTMVEVGVYDALTGGNLASREIVVGSLSNLEEYWFDIFIEVNSEEI